MKTHIPIGQILASLLFLATFFIGCKSDPKKKQVTEPEVAEPQREVIEVVTRSMEFFAPDTINSGWNTFVYKNLSTEPHFILLDKYPEGITIENAQKELGPVFEKGMGLIMEGKMEEAIEAFGGFPEWFANVVFSGGTGLISPRETAISTVNLQPGYYLMECYVRMPDGKFHSTMGMTKELIVLDTDSGQAAPASSVDIAISSESGISYTGDITAGNTTFSVTYGDQIVHENFVGHDVNLARAEDGADLEALEAWLNWATPTGLMSSSLPEGFTFLGGTNDAPGGSVLYFEVKLEPGNYILFSEVPNSRSKEMFKSFTVE